MAKSLTKVDRIDEANEGKSSTQKRASKMPALELKNGIAARELRRKLDLNQLDFWSRLGVTQSGGSRYESGRNMPTPTLLLLNAVYASNRSAEKLVQYLREA